MNRRNFLKSSAALTASTAVLRTKTLAQLTQPIAPQAANVWARPLHFVYPIQNGNVSSPPTDDELLAAFDMVPGGLTALTPFLLNVKNPSQYVSMINAVQSRGIIFNPGVGGPAANGPLYTPSNQAIAAGYRQYTSYIRLENTQGFYNNPGGQADIQAMIDYCVNTCGFEHIMLNPWPLDSNGNAVPFTNPELDASFDQVRLDFNHSTYVVNPDPNNWTVNTTEVAAIQAYRPTINIVINYESEPQHQALYHLELNNPGSSIPAMNITATECQNSPQKWHWAPPFTHIYDPLALGTWPWIADRLGNSAIATPGSVDLQISVALTQTGTGYSKTLTVTNQGTGLAPVVTVTSATLGSATGAGIPALLGDLQPNQSASVSLTFPASAGARNSPALSRVAGIYNGGTFGGTIRTILP